MIGRLLLLLCLVAGTALAGIEPLVFSSPEEEQRFRVLTGELRCPKCQNQSIADSDAPIAHDLRIRTLDLLQQGMSDQEIVDHLVARYGEFIHYRPSLNTGTALLWFGPALVLLVALAILLWRRRRVPVAPLPAPAQTHEQVAALLHRHGAEDDA